MKIRNLIGAAALGAVVGLTGGLTGCPNKKVVEVKKYDDGFRIIQYNPHNSFWYFVRGKKTNPAFCKSFKTAEITSILKQSGKDRVFLKDKIYERLSGKFSVDEIYNSRTNETCYRKLSDADFYLSKSERLCTPKELEIADKHLRKQAKKFKFLEEEKKWIKSCKPVIRGNIMDGWK
ncbi:MAG: hypothetical protein U9Q69_03660 [Nanoarchaeota archaeon]|nr:hypothetical protein [Nanoarchaeota archaeon]